MVIVENGLSPVAAIHDMIDRPWKFHIQFASHAGMSPAQQCVDTIDSFLTFLRLNLVVVFPDGRRIIQQARITRLAIVFEKTNPEDEFFAED